MTRCWHGLRHVILVPALGLWLTTPARAESALFLSSEPRALELFGALELALRGYGPVVILHHGPEGEGEEAHLASARRLSAGAGASAAVWVERAPPERLRAVAAAEPERPFDAPLPEPASTIEPRVFGSIAASLVLQTLRSQPASAAASASRSGSAAAPAMPARTDTERAPRFFVRPGFVLGMAFVGQGRTADRPPSVALVTQAQEYVAEGGAQSYLYENGYDCQVSGAAPLIASQCTVAVSNPGVVYAPVFDVSAGLRIWRDLALALTVRHNPRAGEGRLASVLLGTEVSWALLSAPRRGWYAEVAGGFGVGRIQVRPGTESQRKGPYVSSGLFDLRGGALIGYKFLPRLGLFAGLTLHAMLPDELWVLDPKVGVEFRL